MRTLLPLIFLHFSIVLFAQERNDKFSGGLVASCAIPTGEFKSVYGKGAAGINLNVMNCPDINYPFFIGIDLGYHYMDGDTYLHSGTVTSYEKTAASNFVSIFPKVRLQHPTSKKASPFAEALCGANFFYSAEKITTNTYSSGEIKERKIKDVTAKPGVGFAAGINIPMKNSTTRLEIKSMYLVSGRTHYLADPVYSSTGDLSFKQMRSRTDMLMFQLGFNL